MPHLLLSSLALFALFSYDLSSFSWDGETRFSVCLSVCLSVALFLGTGGQLFTRGEREELQLTELDTLSKGARTRTSLEREAGPGAGPFLGPFSWFSDTVLLLLLGTVLLILGTALLILGTGWVVWDAGRWLAGTGEVWLRCGSWIHRRRLSFNGEGTIVIVIIIVIITWACEGYVLAFMHLSIYWFVCMYVTNFSQKLLDQIAWNFQGCFIIIQGPID